MNTLAKCILNFVWMVIISLLLLTEAVATTEFLILANDNQQVDCEFLEIKGNNVLCTTNDLLIAYDLNQIRKIVLMNRDNPRHFQNFTQETIKTINNLNSDKKANEQLKSKIKKFTSNKLGMTQPLSFDSLPSFIQSLKDNFKYQITNRTLSTILILSGFVVFLIGSIGFLISTFRKSILWGLGCIFLPFISFIFLFVHWRVASKPFFVLLLGILISFSGTMLVPVEGKNQNIAKSKSTTTYDNKKQNNGRFQCSGKIYCSEMSSCAEAKFYIRNCPGTKMDGDNDGIPCEKQLCRN